MFSIARSSTSSVFRTARLFPSSRLSLRALISTNNKINIDSSVFKYSSGPLTVKYTAEHEWIAQHPDGVAFVGITKYASDALGDATYVELPEVGDDVASGDSIGSVESVKSSSEIYSPVDGEVLEVNEELNSKPQLINEDPLGEGWLAKFQISKSIEEFNNLLTEEEYTQSLHEEGDH